MYKKCAKRSNKYLAKGPLIIKRLLCKYTLITDGKTINRVLVSVNQRPRKLPIRLMRRKRPTTLWRKYDDGAEMPNNAKTH